MQWANEWPPSTQLTFNQARHAFHETNTKVARVNRIVGLKEALKNAKDAKRNNKVVWLSKALAGWEENPASE